MSGNGNRNSMLLKPEWLSILFCVVIGELSIKRIDSLLPGGHHSKGDRKGTPLLYTENLLARLMYSIVLVSCPQYISNTRPSRFVILSAAKDLCPAKDPSLRSG